MEYLKSKLVKFYKIPRIIHGSHIIKYFLNKNFKKFHAPVVTQGKPPD